MGLTAALAVAIVVRVLDDAYCSAITFLPAIGVRRIDATEIRPVGQILQTFQDELIGFDAGEQMAAALAIRLALLKELSDLRIAFFDEPTTNMDEERRRNLAQQIGRIKDFDQLFVISHDDAFEGFTDRVVSVRGQAEGDFR